MPFLMPPRRKFDKKNATTFSVVHRGHDDEKYFDNDASRHVLVPVGKREEKKIKTKQQLEKELGDEVKAIRENEGLAAQYGIFYDDTKYDYMQHLKPIGALEDAVFIAKKTKPEKKKDDLIELLKDQLPSENTRKITQADLENIPQDLKGFNPNLDPRLRETLEALEDEAYIEETEGNVEDFFKDILQSGEAGPEDEFDEYGEYDEWDMDNYEGEFDDYDNDRYEEQDTPYNEGEAPEAAENVVVHTAWEKDFAKFKNKHQDLDDSDNFDSDNFDSDNELEERDELPELPTVKKASKTKQRKKKGAMTDTSSFSMSSSAVYRTEGLTLLDDRYEKLSRDFEKEEDDDYSEFKMEEERGDFEDMLDDFLDNYELDRGGRKLMKKNEEMQRMQKVLSSVSKGKKSKGVSTLDRLNSLKLE